jgi:hypothetical protein
MKMDFSQFWPFLFAVLVVFVIYRRFRRNFGQQRLLPARMQVRIVVLLIVGGLLLPSALRSMALLSAVLAGVAAGVALALWGAARTRFLMIDKQLYYVPHTYTGVCCFSVGSSTGYCRLMAQRMRPEPPAQGLKPLRPPGWREAP